MTTIKQVTVLVGLVALAYIGVRWGDSLVAPIRSALGMAPDSGRDAGGPAPSAELAEETLDRFERFRSGGAGDRLALSGTELTSVVRYALPGIVPPGVAEPTVALDDRDVHLSARIALDAFPKIPELEEVVGMLPDTVSVDLEGGLIPLDQSHLALLVDRVHVARVRLPRRLIAAVLDGLGRDGRPGLPEDALRVPLPDGLERAYVQRDSLVLVARLDPA